MKRTRFPLRRLFSIAGIALASLVALILILSIFRVSIPLGFLQPKIANAASGALGRDVRIEKAPRVVIGLKPTFKIEALTIANPEDWPGESEIPFARLDRLFVKLGLFPLLRKDIRIDDLEISGLHLELEEMADGRKNWAFENLATTEDGEEPVPATADSGPGYEFSELRRLSIEDIGLRSLNPEGEEKFELVIDTVEGRAASGEALTLELAGAFQDRPFKGKIQGDSLGDLIADDEAWPYEFSAAFDNLTVGLNGMLGTRDLSVGDEHSFEIDAPDLANLEEFTGPLPRFGAVRLTGKLQFTKEGFAMPALTGNLGDTTLNGDLNIDTTEKPPRVDGNLNLGSFDVAVFRKPESPVEDDSEKPAEDREGESEKSEAETAALKPNPKEAALLPVVGEVRVTVAEVVNPKVKVRHLDMGVQLEESALTADVSVEFAEAPLRGDLDIQRSDQEDNPITLVLDLVAQKADIGELVTFYTGARGFSGEFERLQFKIEGGGGSLGEAWNHKRVVLDVTDAAMTYRKEETVTEFQLDRGFVDGAWNRESRMGAEGIFLGSAFDITYNRLPARKASEENPPFLEFSGTAAGATFRLAGETPLNEGDPKEPLTLEVGGESLGQLHNWVGIPEAVAIPYAVKGTILLENGFHLDLKEGKIGQSSLSGEVGMKKDSEEAAGAFLAKLAIDVLDFGELSPLFPEKVETDDQPGIDFDAPILPAGVHIDDADVDLKIVRLVADESTEIGDLSLTATIRDGWVEKAPFQFSLNDTAFAGTAGFDFRGEQPEARVDLKGGPVDIGKILGQLGVAEGLDATAGKFGLLVHARGTSLKEMLIESDLDVNFSEARWTIADANTGAKLPIAIESGSIGGNRGEDTILQLSGSVAGAPLKFTVRTDGIDALLKENEQINLAAEMELAESTIALAGRALLPLDRKDLDARLTWKMNRMSGWNDLLDIDLPPIGPLTLGGNIRVVESGYSLSDLEFKIGETDLTGNLSLNTAGTRPRLEVDLNTSRFQINDFAAKGWTAVKKAKKPETGAIEQVAAADAELAKLLSADVLQSHDARITLNAGDVRSGKDTLGGGSLIASVRDGRLKIAPLTVAIPGGEFSASMDYFPRATTYDWELTAKTRRFDYGVLARRKDPETDSGGLLFVDIALKNTNAPIDDFVLAHSTGHFNFEVCPEKMNAGLFDFWGANLLFAILPRIDSERNSKVNCIIGHLKMESGVMTPEALGIDTTRVRVISEGSIDFKTENIDLLLVPRAKKPEFLRAGTKIMVKGKLDEPQIETGPLPILRTLARMTGSTVLFPGNLLFQERIPEDGSDVCSCEKP